MVGEIVWSVVCRVLVCCLVMWWSNTFPGCLSLGRFFFFLLLLFLIFFCVVFFGMLFENFFCVCKIFFGDQYADLKNVGYFSLMFVFDDVLDFFIC